MCRKTTRAIVVDKGMLCVVAVDIYVCWVPKGCHCLL